MDEGTRKTISLSHKQAGVSAISIAALAALLTGPLAQIFQTKEKADVVQNMQQAQVLELKTLMNENKRDIIDKINDAVKSVAGNVDKHETRIVNLEFIQMKAGGK